MSFRKERKYRLSFSEKELLKQLLLARGMSRLHPSRQVNSCYFDTNDYTLFHESEEGVLPRKKVRLRWYDAETKLSKETKFSSIEGRFKVVSSHMKFNAKINKFDVNFYDGMYGILNPVLIVSYQREYFMLDQLRITFDSKIEYTDLHSIGRQKYFDHECVMEIKTPINISNDYIEKIVQYPTSRFSKYSRGILMTDRLL